MSECRQCNDAIRQIRLILGGVDVEDLADEVQEIVRANTEMTDSLAAALARVARLEAALRVYANIENWSSTTVYTYSTGKIDAWGNDEEKDIEIDLGQKIIWSNYPSDGPDAARAALERE